MLEAWFDFGDGRYLFRMGLEPVRALEQLHGSLGAMYGALSQAVEDWDGEHPPFSVRLLMPLVRDIIAAGLISGHSEVEKGKYRVVYPKDVEALVREHVPTEPHKPSLMLAQTLLYIQWYGVPAKYRKELSA